MGFVLAVLARSFDEAVRLRRMFALDAPLFAHSLVLGAGRRDWSEGEFLQLDLDVPRRIVNELLGDASLDEELVSFSCVRAPLSTLDQVVLPAEMKDLVASIIGHHSASCEKRAAWGIDEVVTYGRGLVFLFSGAPGTGKTMLANAIASALRKRLFIVDVAKLASGEGSLESKIDAIFREARLLDTILFFDEAEQLFTSRRAGNSAMPTLLTRLERFEGTAILATNMEDTLDEALHRRIIATVRFEAPTVWRRHLPPKLPLAPDVDTEALTRNFELTGGLIKNAVLASVLHAVSRDAPCVTMQDLVHGARLQVRIRDDESGSLLRPEVCLDDVVLSGDARDRIERFVSAARVRGTMLAEWGFGRTLGRGLTFAALLSGPLASEAHARLAAVAGQGRATSLREGLRAAPSGKRGHLVPVLQATRLQMPERT